ncbi:hypothetical protein EYZ11_006920 [Aspergillus tanneri]|uniref:Uncharacterized protein n=1 Tax=Aspergillus tanneri TaxID=1220188 RepID=A0A4S3JES3_9EURO|nr:hypothetical protein EYZ11_006920 [Aspergillus tanneri]
MQTELIRIAMCGPQIAYRSITPDFFENLDYHNVLSQIARNAEMGTIPINTTD